MYHTIPHANDLPPRNLGVLSNEIVRYTPRSLSNYFYSPDNSILALNVILELGIGLACDKAECHLRFIRS